ncbi:hypothetical protein Efla_005134 [Eimeria flavescens]
MILPAAAAAAAIAATVTASAAPAALCRSPRAAICLLLLLLLPLQLGCGVSAAAAAAAGAAASSSAGSSRNWTAVLQQQQHPQQEQQREQQQQQEQQQEQQQQPVVSDALLLDLLRRAEVIRGAPPKGAPEGWEILAENSDCTVYRRLREGGPDYEYAVRGHFSDISAAAYISALNVLPLRAAWDSTAKEIRLVKVTPLSPPPPDSAATAGSSSSIRSGRGVVSPPQGPPSQQAGEGPLQVAAGGPPHAAGSPVHAVGGPEFEEVMYWRVSLPWPAQDRDFVFARRLRGYRLAAASSSSSSSNNLYALVCGQLHVAAPAIPETKDAVRVSVYEAAVIAFPSNGGGAPSGSPAGDPAAQGGALPLQQGPSAAPLAAGGDPEQNGVTYVAFHYDKSKSPVPSWLRSYVASQSLPATMRSLRRTALNWLSPSGSVKDPGALRNPQGAPLSEEELLAIEQQHNMHSMQWVSRAQGPPTRIGAPASSQQPTGETPQQHKQQQQREAGNACARAAVSPLGNAAAPAAAAAAAAAAELRGLLVRGRRGDPESCAVRPWALPVMLGGPHELISGCPPFVLALKLIPNTLRGGPSREPVGRKGAPCQWGPPEAAREALRWALRLLGSPYLGPPCACTDPRLRQGLTGPSCYCFEGAPPVAGGPGGPPGLHCSLSQATGLACGHRVLQEAAQWGSSRRVTYRRP